MYLPTSYPVGLGQGSDVSIGGIEVNGPLLAAGLGILLLAAYLTGRKKRKRRRIARRLQSYL